MAKAYFMVRAVVEAPHRRKFDHWYSSHHLPMALAEFKAEKCWRFWSAADPAVHYAVYQFPDIARLNAAMKSEGFKLPGRRLRSGLAGGRHPARATWWSWSRRRPADALDHDPIRVNRIMV